MLAPVALCRDGGYYLDLAQEDYYLKGGEPPGLWYGEGAARVGLKGKVEREPFLKIWDGFGPDGTALRKSAGRDTLYIRADGKEFRPRHAYDLTFSAPKSVSLLWAMAIPEIRQRIQEAHEQAVRQALDYIERVAGLTRTGKGGHTIVEADMVFAIFPHFTSRLVPGETVPDVNMHSHCLAFNAAIFTNTVRWML